MDKAEWKEAWERVLPVLTFEDKCKIAEARNVNLGNGQRLSKITPPTIIELCLSPCGRTS